jgi:hypothetical protein
MSTITIEGNVLVDFIFVCVVVVTVVKDNRMDKTTKRAMTDVVTACNETQNKESVNNNTNCLLEVQ